MKQVAILKKLATKNANTRKDITITPDECKLELYPRKSQLSVFDRLDLMCELTAGKDDKGAIFKGFINAIQIHDEIIKDMEERMKHIEHLKSDLKKKTRLYANYTAAWAVMFSSMGSYNEYKEAKVTMLTWDSDYHAAIDRQNKDEILRLENFKKHFEALEKVNGPIEKMENAVEDALDSRNEAARLLQDAEMALDKLKIVERRAADKITDDHIHADEQRVPFSDLFPSLRLGYILSTINDQEVEMLPFNDVMRIIRESQSPHMAAFRRYDYRYDPFHIKWWTMPELRAMKIFVDDPLLPQIAFVNVVNTGDVDAVKRSLLQGEDPNSLDVSGCSAMHFAAGNADLPMVELLITAGCKVDTRDKYMVTPYLLSVRRGHLDMAKRLLSLGANRLATDRNGRGALFDAVTNGNLEMIQFLLEKDNCNDADSIWGFTPLHVAANQGNIPVLKLLLNFGVSIYRKSNAGKTAEEVALEANHKEANKMLETERLTAPAQHAISNPDKELNIWIGDLSALDPEWSAEVGITHVICMTDPEDAERPGAMLRAKASADGIPESSIYWLEEENKDAYGNGNNSSTAGMRGGGAGGGMGTGTGTGELALALTPESSPSPGGGLRTHNFKSVQSQSSVGSMSMSMSASMTRGGPRHIICAVENDDDDKSHDSWNNLMKVLPRIMEHFLRILRKGSATILVCDPSGDCLAPAVVAAALHLDTRVRSKETIARCAEARPSVRVSRSMRRGLEEMETTLDAKRLERLNVRLRHSDIVSMYF